MDDKIIKLMMPENPTPEEARIIEAYRRGYYEGIRETAAKHNDMLHKALNGADRARYRKMLRGFLARYFDYLNSQFSIDA